MTRPPGRASTRGRVPNECSLIGPVALDCWTGLNVGDAATTLGSAVVTTFCSGISRVWP